MLLDDMHLLKIHLLDRQNLTMLTVTRQVQVPFMVPVNVSAIAFAVVVFFYF